MKLIAAAVLLVGAVQESSPWKAADAEAEIAAAAKRSAKEYRRVLVVWGAAGDSGSAALAKMLKSDRGVSRKLLYEYDVVYVEAGEGRHAELASKLGADPPAGLPRLSVLDAERKPLAHAGSAEWATDDKPDPKKLVAWLEQHQATAPKAEDVLGAALKTAGEGGRRVMLVFGAPW